MNTINNSQFFVLLDDVINNNTPISKSELSAAYSSFSGEIIAKLDSEADFSSAFRILGSLQIELHTLQSGIIAPNCEAGEKCGNRYRVS